MNNLKKKLMKLQSQREMLIEQRDSSNIDEWVKNHNEILETERLICKNEGVMYADIYEFGIKCYLNISVNADFNRALVMIEGDVVIQFNQVEEFKFGGINDEVIESHELHSKGMDICGSFIVENSNWIDALKTQNSIHNCFNESYWNKLSHYIIRVKDGEFSCIAKGWKIIE